LIEDCVYIIRVADAFKFATHRSSASFGFRLIWDGIEEPLSKSPFSWQKVL
jgi:hypothetical protein